METRVLQSRKCIITQNYYNKHKAVDIVKEGYLLDNIVAHTDGKIIYIQDGYNNMKGSSGIKAYGNFIKIDHGRGYSTLYAHMQKGLKYKVGDYVKKGTILGYMSDSGNAYGSHLHFEVFKDGIKIDPTKYLNSNLFSNNLKYKVGDKVNINGVFISSTSTNKLEPSITRGTITKVIEDAINPYLLDNGKIGWVNDNTIIENKYLVNKNYKGNSIVDALKEINIDSSFTYRSKLALINNIKNYKGNSEQNTYLLSLLLEGKLIRA